MNKHLEWLYKYSPISLQNVWFSIRGLKTFSERRFSPFYGNYIKFVMQSQWYTKEEFERLQNKSLQSIVKHAYDTVPYYHRVFRSLNLTPEDIRNKGDLNKLPIIDKEEVRKHLDEFISKKYHWWQKVKASTSGSTGSNLQIMWGKKSVIREHCFMDRHKGWAGVNLTDNLAHFGSSTILIPEVQKNPPFWRNCIPERRTYFSPFHLSEKNLPEYIEKLKQDNSQVILGHSSKIYIVARHMLKETVDGINPKAVFTSSEMLLPYQRKVIEEAFGCRVFDYYGNNEHVSFIAQCEKGNYHINSEYGIIEFIKGGEEVVSGETGEMVCTGFINYAMPLLRYRMEDIATPSDETCDCNRELPLVKSIQGRKGDIIITKDNRYLTTETIVEGIDKMESIKEWQVIQKSKESYVINLTVDQDYYSENDVSRLREIVRRRVGEGKIEINIVDSIMRPGNKFRAVMSELKI